MEVKKSYAADLEHGRKTAFLLGMVVALALCFAALELTTHPQDAAESTDMLEEIEQDMELLPTLDQKDMIAAEQEVTSQPQLAEQLVEVKESQPTEAQAKNDAPILPVKVEPVPVEVPPELSEDLKKVKPMVLDVNDNPANLRIVEDTPKPQGGWVEFMKWLTKTLKYPPTAKAQKIQGTVTVAFIVNIDGTVSDMKVVKSADPSLDREALRVMKLMPKWEAGIDKGSPARSMVAIPVVFKL